MRVLAITKLFPSAVEPFAAPFNRQQFAALARRCDVEVLATIPWFPGAGLVARWSSAGRLARVPAVETIDGLAVRHPRTLFLPRLAHATWGPLYAASIAPVVARYRGKIDVVLGAWAYPDGFASVIAARLLGVPCVVKLHGSDINLDARRHGPRRMLSWALPRANRIVAVSRALGDAAIELGVPADKISIVMNGVDRALFHPRDRAEARAALGLPPGPIALYVGNLKPEKGVMDLPAAWAKVLARMPDATLVVVGDGPLAPALRAAFEPFGDRARIVPRRPLDEIPVWMAAATILVLPSHAEGTPNVVLEALSSGRRVVATEVGGVPDLLASPELGTLVPPRAPDALAEATVRALHAPYIPATVAALGGRGGWDASAAALYEVLLGAVGATAPPNHEVPTHARRAG